MQIIDFDLDRDHVELNQLLKLVGLADSGGQGKAIVASGDVTVDGAVELRSGCWASRASPPARLHIALLATNLGVEPFG